MTDTSKVISNKTKHVEAEKKLNNHITCCTKLTNALLVKVELISTKGWTKDLIHGYSILNGEKYFSREGDLQNYFAFQPVKYFNLVTNDIVTEWKSKGFSDESTKPPAISDINLNPRLDYSNNPNFRIKFNTNCLNGLIW